MKRFIAGALAAVAALGYVAWSENGEGTFDGGSSRGYEYRWFRFDVGMHVLEIHVGTRE